MKGSTRMVTRGPTTPAGNSGLDVLYELPTQLLPRRCENIVVTPITVLESISGDSRVRRDGLRQNPSHEFWEALVGSGQRPPERGRLTIDLSGITVVPIKHSAGTIVMAREIFRRQSESLS